MIELDNVTKLFHVGPVEVRALSGVTTTIADGEMVALMGASGSGKTTLMNILGCLDVPTSGRYVLDGRSVGRLSDHRLAEIRNRRIGFVFQNYNLLSRLTAIANVELPLLYASRSSTGRLAREALARVGIADRANHRPTEMSGGQQQRVAIARALVNEPSILLADEPTGNLDSRTSLEIIGLLQGLNRDSGITVVIVTHEDDIAQYAERIIRLRDGEILSDRPVRDRTIAPANLNGAEVAP